MLNNYAAKVAKQMEGYWSVDFCLSKTNEWILIDMATGNRSWHPDCQFNPIKQLEPKVSNFQVSEWGRDK